MRGNQAGTPTLLTDRFSKAFEFAEKAHRGTTRKGTAIPYISHPMAVAAMVLEYGGTEDQAIGALLHDTVEDCGVTCAETAERFGRSVERIVNDCTDSETEPKPPWKERKVKYIAHLDGGADAASLIVSAADKLHNARAILRDVRRDGARVWDRFSARPTEILWYYEKLAAAFTRRGAEGGAGLQELAKDLQAAVAEMRGVAG